MTSPSIIHARCACWSAPRQLEEQNDQKRTRVPVLERSATYGAYGPCSTACGLVLTSCADRRPMTRIATSYACVCTRAFGACRFTVPHSAAAARSGNARSPSRCGIPRQARRAEVSQHLSSTTSSMWVECNTVEFPAPSISQTPACASESVRARQSLGPTRHPTQ